MHAPEQTLRSTDNGVTWQSDGLRRDEWHHVLVELALLALGAEPARGPSRRDGGDVFSFDVPFAPGPGQSMLAVHVRGSFAAGTRDAVRAFLGRGGAQVVAVGSG